MDSTEVLMPFIIKAQKGSEEVIIFGRAANELEAMGMVQDAQFALGSGFRVWFDNK